MKNFGKFLFYIFLMGVISSCNKNEEVIDPCKLGAFLYQPSGIKHTIEYNAQGLAVRKSGKLNFRGRLIDFYDNYIYDSNNQLVSMEDSWDGKPNSKHKFTWTGNQLTKTVVDDYNMETTPQYTTVYNFKYNSKGLISEIIIQYNGRVPDVRMAYEYDENNVEIRLTRTVIATGEVNLKIETKPIHSAKHPEQLMPKRGLPYDVSERHPWIYAMGGVGTTVEVFALRNGQLTSISKGTIENIKMNARGTITEYGNVKYELIDCE
jgi:hypothetical protein